MEAPGKLDSHPVEPSLRYMLLLCGVTVYARRYSGRWGADCAPHSACMDVGPDQDGGKIKICTIEGFDFGMYKDAGAKIGNGRHHERRSWCLRGRFCSSGCTVRRWTSYIFRLFHHFGWVSLQEKPRWCLLLIFYANEHRFYSFMGSSSLPHPGCGAWRRRFGLIVRGARKRGT